MRSWDSRASKQKRSFWVLPNCLPKKHHGTVLHQDTRASLLGMECNLGVSRTEPGCSRDLQTYLQRPSMQAKLPGEGTPAAVPLVEQLTSLVSLKGEDLMCCRLRPRMWLSTIDCGLVFQRTYLEAAYCSCLEVERRKGARQRLGNAGSTLCASLEVGKTTPYSNQIGTFGGLSGLPIQALSRGRSSSCKLRRTLSWISDQLSLCWVPEVRSFGPTCTPNRMQMPRQACRERHGHMVKRP